MSFEPSFRIAHVNDDRPHADRAAALRTWPNTESLADLLVHRHALSGFDCHRQAVLDLLIERTCLLATEHAESDVSVIDEGHGFVALVADVEQGSARYRLV